MPRPKAKILMTPTPTKADEIAAIKQIVQQLGRDSYLGPWLQDALPYLADTLRSDIPPVPAFQLHQQGAAERDLGILSWQKAQLEA